jgi:type VI secretion system protein ImpA
MTMLTVDELLAPVPGDDPCGPDLFFSSEFDAIAHARVADDPSLDQGVWETRCKEADWDFVVKQCSTLLAGRSKDLRLAVWLAEGQARSGNLRGFGDACLVLAGMCEQYWGRMHPQGDDDHEQRIGNLSWLAQRSGQWVGGIAGEGAEVLEHVCTAIDRLQAAIDGILGVDAPSLGEAQYALRLMQDAAGPPVPGEVPLATAKATRTLSIGQAPQTRAHALLCLRQVAAYFRQHEPHSPVSYLADKAADWGDMPLHGWLRTVVKDATALGQLEEMLGTGVKDASG